VAAVIGATFLVGWVISLIMVNPFLLLAQQARAINAPVQPRRGPVRGVREAVEIAEPVEGMLAASETSKRTRPRSSRPRLRGCRLGAVAYP